MKFHERKSWERLKKKSGWNCERNEEEEKEAMYGISISSADRRASWEKK